MSWDRGGRGDKACWHAQACHLGCAPSSGSLVASASCQASQVRPEEVGNAPQPGTLRRLASPQDACGHHQHTLLVKNSGLGQHRQGAPGPGWAGLWRGGPASETSLLGLWAGSLCVQKLLGRHSRKGETALGHLGHWGLAQHPASRPSPQAELLGSLSRSRGAGCHFQDATRLRPPHPSSE